MPLLALDRTDARIDDFFGTTGSDDAKIIKKCIPNYTILNYSHGIFYFVYRIYQACKAIFGYSDWQKARVQLIHLIDDRVTFNSLEFHTRSEERFFADKMLQAFLKSYLYVSVGEEILRDSVHHKMEKEDFCSALHEVNEDFYEKFQKKRKNSARIIHGTLIPIPGTPNFNWEPKKSKLY